MKIELAGIHKTYKRKKVLDGVSLSVKEGSCVGILGGNGCGKSTLLSILAGVQRADEGAFLCDGKDLLADDRQRLELVGYVPQEDPLIEELNAWDNLRMWYDRRTLQRELKEGMLGILGIEDFLKVPVRKMSGGMKKRLSIACAVVGNPRILLLDEPTAALDLICRERIYHYFAQFKSNGGTLILTTHEVPELELCEECFILKQGQVTSYHYDGDIHRLAGLL